MFGRHFHHETFFCLSVWTVEGLGVIDNQVIIDCTAKNTHTQVVIHLLIITITEPIIVLYSNTYIQYVARASLTPIISSTYM